MKQKLFLYPLFCHFFFTLIHAQNSSESLFARVPELAARRDKEALFVRLQEAWEDGDPVRILTELDYGIVLALIQKITPEELALFGQATSYARFKLFIEQYYQLFLECFALMTDAQVEAYLLALPADFLKAVLFDTSQKRIDLLVHTLTPERMALIVTVTAHKLPDFTRKKETTTKNDFIRIEAFNRILSSLSVAHLNTLFATASAELLSELFAIFTPAKK